MTTWILILIYGRRNNAMGITMVLKILPQLAVFLETLMS